MRVLITGVNGFVGPHLSARLLASCPDCELWGQAWGEAGRDRLAELAPALELIDADLTAPSSLDAMVKRARPDLLFHLAAASSVASSWSNPATILEINAVGQVHLFEALRRAGIAPVTVVASSAEVYGRGSSVPGPLDEDAPLQPLSPYAVSKAAQDLIAAQYHAAHGLPTVRLRLFNHTGPGQDSHFVAPSFARQIAEIERGLRPPRIEVGNLDVVRDFSDVEDVARAYWLAATRGRPGEVYNICSGRPVTIRQVLDTLLAMSSVEVEVVTTADRRRSSDAAALIGDHSRFSEATGWQPELPLEYTLGRLLEWWRKRP